VNSPIEWITISNGYTMVARDFASCIQSGSLLGLFKICLEALSITVVFLLIFPFRQLILYCFRLDCFVFLDTGSRAFVHYC